MKTLAMRRFVRGICERLGRIEPGDAGLWGCHLRDAFGVALADRSVGALKQPLPPRGIKWLALKAPMQWRHALRMTICGEEKRVLRCAQDDNVSVVEKRVLRCAQDDKVSVVEKRVLPLHSVQGQDDNVWVVGEAGPSPSLRSGSG